MPEVQSAGRPKRQLDGLLWCNEWSRENIRHLDDIELLRTYLDSLRPTHCKIEHFVPATHTETAKRLRAWNIRFNTIEVRKASAETTKKITDEELADATETALACDADTLVVTKQEWFPYIEDLDDFGVFLTDIRCFKHHCEIFARGCDAPWAFESQTWNLTWTAFYQMTERQTFETGMIFLSTAQKKKADADGQETGRTLVHNRLPNICFTRDRLLFYEIQRMASVRAKWKRQEFRFEIAYYLNFYYPLIYGGFDHIALLVSQCLKLGVPEARVGVTYKAFLDELQGRNAALYAIFADPEQANFIKRIGALRHYASHRGSLMPTKLLEKPQKEPTNEELDTQIAEAGMDDFLANIPEGELRESFRETLRYNFRVAYYERVGKVIDGVVPIELDGKPGFIRPATDTDWNFRRFLLFMNKVLTELGKAL